MDLVYAAINSGAVTMKKNDEKRAEFRWIKKNFKAICKNCVTLQRLTLGSQGLTKRRESLITARDVIKNLNKYCIASSVTTASRYQIHRLSKKSVWMVSRGRRIRPVILH
jgi:hypothetical protein